MKNRSWDHASTASHAFPDTCQALLYKFFADPSTSGRLGDYADETPHDLANTHLNLFVVHYLSMSLAREKGDRGERIAREYLEAKGWRFVEANWSCKAGEIDLIFDDPTAPIGSPGTAGVVRVFVEVKTRVPTSYGRPQEAVAWHKQRKLLKAAQWYQQEKDYWGDIRFDVVAIEMHDSGPVIEHVEYAFESR